MGEVSLDSLPDESKLKLPKHPVPVARMGRLAVELEYRSLDLGKLLLVDAMIRIREASTQVGVYALVVDAKDIAAVSFYSKYGFVEFIDEPYTLFLPVKTFGAL